MYTLVARDSRGQVVCMVPLGRQPVAIGRSPECAVLLASTGVSRRHATAYLRDDGAVVITDEGSANGVQVDGELITGPTLVDHSNQIRISEFVLELVPLAQPGPSPEAQPPLVPHDTAPVAKPAAPRPAPTAPAPAPRPTPTAPAPASPVPASDEEPDDDEGVSNFTMLEAHAGAAAAMARSPLQLRGKGGPFAGTIFAVDKPLMIVGRTPENDLVLDDPSISRRHAQLRLGPTGLTFTLLDLRSSNGCFLDGKRVKRAEAAEHSVVRFGDLVFVVEVRREQVARQKRVMSRRRLYVIAASVLALIIGAGVVAYVKRPKPPPPKIVSPEERLRQLQADVQQLIDEGRRRLTQKQWTEAIKELDLAQAKDPLNQDAQTLRRKALLELDNQATYNKGMQFFALGNQENLIKAKEVFARVDAASIYHREVRYKLRAINERLANGYRIEGVSRCKARYWDRCHEALCHFFELLPEDQALAGEGRLREQLKQVEKKLSNKRDFKPCLAKRFLTPIQETGTADPDQALAQKYEQAEVRQVLLLYVQGRLDMALKKLGTLRQNREMRPHEDMLREIDRQFLVIRGKYQEGFSALRERNAKDAQRHFAQVLAADEALLPPRAEDIGLESFYRKEITRSLGDLYFELGDEQYKLGRFRLAYQQWADGLVGAPRHEGLLNGLLQLEKEAERLLREGQGLAGEGDVAKAREKLELARDLVKAGRPLHDDVKKALAELE